MYIEGIQSTNQKRNDNVGTRRSPLQHQRCAVRPFTFKKRLTSRHAQNADANASLTTTQTAHTPNTATMLRTQINKTHTKSPRQKKKEENMNAFPP
jgi:predicted kinase